MGDSLRLYFRYLGISIRSQMQYRASFIMLSIGDFVTTAAEFAAIWALFERFGQIKGWTLPEAALFYGMINMAFAVSESWARGFDSFAGTVRSGDFDRMLLRPRGTILQIAGTELQLFRIGRLTQGLAVLVWSSLALDVGWTLPRIALVVAAVLGGACLFSGLFIIQATICFWTTESLELMNVMTYGGGEAAQFPLTIYHEWFRRFFTYAVPLATVTYYPAIAIPGRADPLGTSRLFQYLSPLVGVLFLLAATRVWRVGVRHYHSTGS